MKEIIAIIRPNKMNATKKIIDELEVPSVTAMPVLGRGNQRGLNAILNGFDVHPGLIAKGHTMGMKFVPKRMLIIVASDENVEIIMNALIKANRTGYIGDGKIFVCPTDDAVRIRTNESGDTAL
ncbi:P-II family nitrogen regulator [Parabacteroides sp. Marseille-P3160]|jgi:nitrogen regulatory protein PII 2|uniref:P-II family nitrogen regulator n=1 Tax=Parabacteroides sp. Marseille-P3160 TaxID=1917887 RepID=UPI0009BB69A6|nr:P-II family nitrogen regulator [Parabacteroides sp. Marseille-P3160]